MLHAITAATAMGAAKPYRRLSARTRYLVAEASPSPLIGSEAYALSGVADGTRTRDHRDHNPGLYQLSYRHRAERG